MSTAAPVPPLVNRLAGLIGQQCAAHTARRLRREPDGVSDQQKVFERRMRDLTGTAFGHETGLNARLSYRQFQRQVTPRTYEGFVPWIERMKQGEADVLCPGRCGYFAVSSGTTAGPSKWLPVNASMLAHFRDTGLDSLLFYAQRTGRGSVFSGRHLFLGGSSALMPVPGSNPPILHGDLSGITALNMPRWTERLLYEPGTAIAQMTDWPAKLTAIAQRTLSADMTLVAGIPSWLLVLAATLRAHAEEKTGRQPPSIKDIWPRLECLIHGGVPIAPFADELRTTYGEGVCFHEVYPASEGFIAVQDAEPADGLRLLTNRGLFFEFLPLADYEETKLATLGERLVPLAGVQPDVDYVIFLTTPAGLVRYVLGDVVRFISVRPPRLVYAGRTKLQLSAFGEHVIERELTDTLATVCRQHGTTAVNFHVAPVFPAPALGQALGRHEWWIELRGCEYPDPTHFSVDLDRELAARNDDYAAKRAGHGLDLPAVRFTRAGLFERWLKQAGKWGGQSKTPRCRSDRQLADQLAALAAD